jgi:PKD repeat protein
VTRPSTVPSPSATPEPSAVPAISQAATVPTVVVPSPHPAPTRAPAPTPAPVAAAPPRVHLTVTPLSGLAPLTVTANAAGSTSVNGIASYVFDFGDGTARVFGATAAHTYCGVGHYQLSVTVTDTAGLHSTAYWPVDVTPQDPPAPSC